jgi:hypothetical protein
MRSTSFRDRPYDSDPRASFAESPLTRANPFWDKPVSGSTMLMVARLALHPTIRTNARGPHRPTPEGGSVPGRSGPEAQEAAIVRLEVRARRTTAGRGRVLQRRGSARERPLPAAEEGVRGQFLTVANPTKFCCPPAKTKLRMITNSLSSSPRRTEVSPSACRAC